MGKFQLRSGERLIINDPHVQWKKSGLETVNGELKLTNMRLVFIQNAHAFAVFTLFLVKSMRKAIALEYDLRKKIKATALSLMGEKRLTIDPGNERPKEFVTMKALTFESEINRINTNQ